MSALVAAGCAKSRFQSVSVVPMIQCVPHGMTNSTDFSVRRMIATSLTMRSRGTTTCTPFEARTRSQPQRPRLGQVLLRRNGFRAAQLVVQENARGDVGPLPPAIGQREQKRQG